MLIGINIVIMNRFVIMRVKRGCWGKLGEGRIRDWLGMLLILLDIAHLLACIPHFINIYYMTDR